MITYMMACMMACMMVCVNNNVRTCHCPCTWQEPLQSSQLAFLSSFHSSLQPPCTFCTAWDSTSYPSQRQSTKQVWQGCVAMRHPCVAMWHPCVAACSASMCSCSHVCVLTLGAGASVSVWTCVQTCFYRHVYRHAYRYVFIGMCTNMSISMTDRCTECAQTCV